MKIKTNNSCTKSSSLKVKHNKTFSDFQINNEVNVINGECFNTLILIINTFEPSDGTGTEFKYYIRELKESGE